MWGQDVLIVKIVDGQFLLRMRHAGISKTFPTSKEALDYAETTGLAQMAAQVSEESENKQKRVDDIVALMAEFQEEHDNLVDEIAEDAPFNEEDVAESKAIIVRLRALLTGKIEDLPRLVGITPHRDYDQDGDIDMGIIIVPPRRSQMKG